MRRGASAFVARTDSKGLNKMARIAIGLVGAVVGYVASGFNPYGAMAGWTIAYGASGYIIPTKLPTAYGPRLSDLRVQDASYGGTIPIVWGR